jgi:hypothetical protein
MNNTNSSGLVLRNARWKDSDEEEVEIEIGNGRDFV